MECVKKATAASDDLVILVTAGPLCPDFSRIKGSTSKGRTGPEGEKFVKFCELLHALRAAAHSRKWAFHFVVENVVMNAHEAHYVLQHSAWRPVFHNGRRRHDVCLSAALVVDKLPQWRGVRTSPR